MTLEQIRYEVRCSYCAQRFSGQTRDMAALLTEHDDKHPFCEGIGCVSRSTWSPDEGAPRWCDDHGVRPSREERDRAMAVAGEAQYRRSIR